MSQKNTNTYDFLINEDDEVMLLLYEKESSVENPQISIDPLKSCAVLRRNDLEGVEITDISEDILDIILEQETLLVCELSAEDNEEDTKITNAYEATVFIQ